MALSKLEVNTINAAIGAATLVIHQLKPTLDSLNIVYDAGGGAKETIDQAGLDDLGQFSGLTKAQLDDALYAMTSTLKGAIDSSYSQLAQLAART